MPISDYYVITLMLGDGTHEIYGYQKRRFSNRTQRKLLKAHKSRKEVKGVWSYQADRFYRSVSEMKKELE